MKEEKKKGGREEDQKIIINIHTNCFAMLIKPFASSTDSRLGKYLKSKCAVQRHFAC